MHPKLDMHLSWFIDLKDNCGVDQTHKGLLEEASYLACLIVDLQLHDFS